jgi:hypothetical protein
VDDYPWRQQRHAFAHRADNSDRTQRFIHHLSKSTADLIFGTGDLSIEKPSTDFGGRMMTDLNKRSYYLARAATSRELARRAASPEIAATHIDFAERYDAIVLEQNSRFESSPRLRRAAESAGEGSSRQILRSARA